MFDIQQGVAIGIFVRFSQNNEQPAKVFHAELWGERKGKYQWLLENELTTTVWKELKPRTPFYLFMPQDGNLKKEYEAGWKVTEIMPVNVLGFQTHRDNFAISFDKEIIEHRLLEMLDLEIADLDFARKYSLRDNRDWKLNEARNVLRDDKEWKKKVIRCLYRPFDQRYCYFSEVAMDYPRRELKIHVAEKNNLCFNFVVLQGFLWTQAEPRSILNNPYFYT